MIVVSRNGLQGVGYLTRQSGANRRVRQELLEDWDLCATKQTPKKIPPLA